MKKICKLLILLLFILLLTGCEVINEDGVIYLFDEEIQNNVFYNVKDSISQITCLESTYSETKNKNITHRIVTKYDNYYSEKEYLEKDDGNGNLIKDYETLTYHYKSEGIDGEYRIDYLNNIETVETFARNVNLDNYFYSHEIQYAIPNWFLSAVSGDHITDLRYLATPDGYMISDYEEIGTNKINLECVYMNKYHVTKVEYITYLVSGSGRNIKYTKESINTIECKYSNNVDSSQVKEHIVERINAGFIRCLNLSLTRWSGGIDSNKNATGNVTYLGDNNYRIESNLSFTIANDANVSKLVRVTFYYPNGIDQTKTANLEIDLKDYNVTVTDGASDQRRSYYSSTGEIYFNIVIQFEIKDGEIIIKDVNAIVSGHLIE